MPEPFLTYPFGVEMGPDYTVGIGRAQASHLLTRLRLFEHIPGPERLKHPHRRRPFFACTDIQRDCHFCGISEAVYFTADIWMWRVGIAYHWNVFQFEHMCCDDVQRECVTFLRENLPQHLRMEAVICAECLTHKESAVRAMYAAHVKMYGPPPKSIDIAPFLDEQGLGHITGVVVDHMRAVDDGATGFKGLAQANDVRVHALRR
jgi:hypothetical protein